MEPLEPGGSPAQARRYSYLPILSLSLIWRNGTTISTSPFIVLPDEAVVDVQVYVDRVVVETFAMGGRATVLANEFRPDPQTTIHLHVFVPREVQEQRQHIVRAGVLVWGIRCGYAPLEEVEGSHEDARAD